MSAPRVPLLLCCLLFFRATRQVDAQSESFGEQCLMTFEKGRDDFVLDTDESVKEGATFIAAPPVTRTNECVRTCCKDPSCNLALMENGEDEGLIKSCFLFDCLYKQTYVCKLVRKKGFNNYILRSVFDEYLRGRSVSSPDKPPVAIAGQDRVVQPHDTVQLDGNQSSDDHKIEIYNWTLVSGSPGVLMEKTTYPDQVLISNLTSGVYKFQLMVTDSAGQSDSTTVTILVLTPEQSEHHCLVPKKIGPCRASYPRWHYNAMTENCEEFSFGGCKPNKNNYLTEQECINACQGVSVMSTHSGRMGHRPLARGESCGQPCRPDQFTCANGCCLDKDLECDKLEQCSDGSDEASCDRLDTKFRILLQIPVDEQKVRCTDPPRTGPCRASFTNWYYNPYTRKCLRFNYGGCEGNENRFEIEESCMNTCKAVSEKDVFARGTFEKQEAQKSQAGGIAVAVLLGVAILITLAVLGYCILKSRKQRAPRVQRVAVNGTHPFTLEDTERLVYNTTTKPV